MLKKKTYKKYFEDKLILLFGAIIIFAFIFFSFGIEQSKGNKIKIDLYGTSTDIDTALFEKSLDDFREKFKKSVDIKYHYISIKQEDGTFTSLQLNRNNASASLLRHDIDENKRRLILQKYYPKKFLKYLRVYNNLQSRVDPNLLLGYVGINPDSFYKKFDSHGNQLLSKEFELLNQIEKDGKFGRSQGLPLLIINEKQYSGRPDVLDIIPFFVREKMLMSDVNFEELLKMEEFNDGVHQCYRDSFCDDKEGYDGSCEFSEGIRICEYKEAKAVNIYVISDGSNNQQPDVILKNFSSEIKNLNIVREEIQNEKSIKLLKEFDLESRSLVYYFDDSIEKSKLFEFYIENEIIEKIGNYYVFNHKILELASGKEDN